MRPRCHMLVRYRTGPASPLLRVRAGLIRPLTLALPETPSTPLKVGTRKAEFTLVRKGDDAMDTSMVRIVCAALAVLFLGIIVLRRKKNAE